MTLVLHYTSGSTATIPHAVIDEIGLPYRLRPMTQGIDQIQQERHPEAGFRLSGRIPALEDGSSVVFETGAILLHIVAKPEAARIMPAYGTREFSRFAQWLFYLTTSPKSTLMEIMWPERWGRLADDQEWIRNRAEERLFAQCDYLESNVSDGTFLSFGLTALDFYLTELARWSSVTETPIWRWQKLGRIVDETRSRPSYQRMLDMHGISWPS